MSAVRTGLRSRAFAGILTSWSFENVADSLMMVIFAVWIQDLTGNPGLASGTFAIFGVPAFFAPFLGRLADRSSRRVMFAVACFAGAACLAPLLLIDDPSQFWWIYIAVLAYATVGFAASACRSGILRDVLSDDDLGRANGLLQSIDQVLRLALPFVAAGVYVWTGPKPIVVAAVVCFVVAGIVILVTRFAEAPVEDDPDPFWRSVTAGFRHVARTPPLGRMTLALVLATCTSALTSSAGFAVLQRMGAPAVWMGPIEAISGVGGLVAGLTVSMLMSRIGRPRVVALGILGLAIGILPMFGPSVWGMIPGMALVGLGFTAAVVAYVTEVQIATPSRLQGRTSTTADVLMQLPRVVLTAGGAAALGLVTDRWILLLAVAVAASSVAVAATVRASAREALAETRPS